jgi:hypothetical protein
MRAALFSYVWRRGEQRHGADGRPGESCSSRGVVARPVLVQERFRGWSVVRPPPRAGSRVPSTWRPYAVQWRSWRRLVPVHSNSIGDVVTVPGVALQWRGWPHRVDSDGKDRSRRPDVTTWPCVVTEKAFEGVAGPPSRVRRVSRTGVGGTVSGLTPASPHSATQWRGWPSPGSW